MVEYEDFKSELRRLFEDVKKFMVDELGFYKKNHENLSVSPLLLKEEELYEKIPPFLLKEGEVAKGYLSFEDGKIYLNYNELNNELYKEWTIAILSYLYPYAYVLEETEYGKWVREETKKAKDSETLKEKMESLCSFLLGGICKAVELDAIATIKGYEFDKIEDKILENFEINKKEYPQLRKGYELCRELQTKAREFKGEADEITRKRIVKASLLVAGRDKNFDSNYEDLASKPLEEIYSMAGGEVFLPKKKLENVRKLAEEIKFKANDYEQWRYIKPLMENLISNAQLYGFPSDLRDKIHLHLINCSKMEDIEPFRKEYVDPNRVLMEEVINYCEKASKGPIKIRFR
jgi:hypothetical protein